MMRQLLHDILTIFSGSKTAKTIILCPIKIGGSPAGMMLQSIGGCQPRVTSRAQGIELISMC